ncbi:cyclic nucleotide-gated cation channel alpha-3 [Lingula anatina]|uniref:Cyclic nucleotide-gated cation channel alpha-3 n=1 Tax=Lingula anatina TaxID=7574 RepID=A0A1S3KDZ3_LINAN|nr:cyclic nucleotide-gated cation channel alpha-3 [Lingula anatina]XP_023933699.1 cyclic nucleotide-gated cation channel alpha-3 [Lingula anatina]XP_023933700.1 cyclic nucleotide-gated cation channel alpha-3 [Lingula anatina]XP_023933702.1 cyclic nucleotide-gated cation channel alpha-3 [Lingula anatina]XP_023933703.1 cyclic nucleotide-gated cation channel alpha-3 [Lingula anatina]|eukprot:XP_023933698.1 cyclic nucleotide-gated cation channel alpha-3 [Lingula anatina]
MMVSRRNNATEAERTVKYTPCGQGDHTDSSDHELEQIAVVSKDGRKEETIALNGPHTLPGPTYPRSSPHDRTKLIGERLSGSKGRSLDASPIYSGKHPMTPPGVAQKSRTPSKQSLIDVVTSKFDRIKRKSTKDEVTFLNRSLRSRSQDVVTPRSIRKQRRKEIEEKFGKRSMKYEKVETSTNSSDKDGCAWTFIFDPSGRLCYWWSSIVSLAFLYNFWVPIYRFAFAEINENNMALWFTLDYTADFIYLLDIVVHFRTGFLDEGVLQTDVTKLRLHYMNSTMFYIDCLCLLPLDFLYLSIDFNSLLRGFRLVKIYRYWTFLDRTERHTNYPNVIRTITLLNYLLAIFHWNACLFHIVAVKIDIKHQDFWELRTQNGSSPDAGIEYMSALYWSTLMMTTTGTLSTRPQTSGQYFFLIMQMICALLLFASVLGHVANIVSNISAARKDFQAKLDSVKTFMSIRRVPLKLQDRVIKWFDYLWMCNKSADEDKTLSLLPDKLKAEIAIHVHLDTLKRVEIFQNTEAGFLCELVLRLRPVLFSPGDYICRKGEVGKEMYIVNRGKLQVVADNGKTVLATLKPGSYFGEISILNMGTAGNRRTASVRSVGYSDLFCLSKTDLWDVLRDYPAARVRLEAIAVKRLEKYKKAPIEQASMSRSRSTPGLVESSGKIPLEAMMIQRHYTLPVGLISHSPSCGAAHAHSMQSLHSDSDNNANHGDAQSCRAASQQEGLLQLRSLSRSPIPPPLQHINNSHSCPPSRSGSPSNIRVSPSMTPISPRSVQSAIQPSDLAGRLLEPNKQKHFSSTAPPSPNYLNTSSFQLPASTSMNFFANASSPFTLQPPNFLHPTTANFPTMAPSPTLTVPMNSLAGSSTGSVGARNQLPAPDALLAELTRLRERVAALESENASLNVKVNQQQWEVESRLTEIELQIQAGSDEESDTCPAEIEDRNKESVI